MHKILHGFLEGVQWRDFFQMADTSRLRGHSQKLKKERSRLYLRKFTFSQRVVNMWNDPPADIVIAPTTNAARGPDDRQSNSNNTHRSFASTNIYVACQ